jgi:hypothetical protein
MSNLDTVVTTAKSFAGQQEIQPNLGFKDNIPHTPPFSVLMNNAGFYKGASWCGFFVIVVMEIVYKPQPVIWAYLSKYLSPGTQAMWAAFKASKEIHTSQVPQLGSVAVWEEGSGTNGHTGIVIDADGKHFTTAEGNSNSDGSRNGYEVAINTHTLGLPHSVNGLNLLGFGWMPV